MWAKEVMRFALQVLPDLLSHLGEARKQDAFTELAGLFKDHNGDATQARKGIRNIKSRKASIANSRADVDAQLAAQEKAAKKPKSRAKRKPANG